MKYKMIVKKEQGVTLIELMIVLVIAAFLVAGIYSLFITQHRSYTVQDQVAGVQQDARVALDIMARDIRMAGFLIGSQGFNVNTYTFAVTPNNGGGSPPASNPDVITVVAAADQFMSGVNPVTVRNVDVSTKGATLGVHNPVTDTWSDADIGSFFDDDKKKFVAFEGNSTLYQIQPSGINGQILTLNSSPPVSLATILDSTVSPPREGARVYRVKAITYSAINPTTGVPDGVLRRDENTGNGAQPLAGDGITTFVEDLQFTYQVQGQTDPTLWYNTPAAAGATNDAIRMVRIDLVVRTAVPDPKDTTFTQPPLRDHTSGLNGPDGFRRRVYTTVVKVRNLK